MTEKTIENTFAEKTIENTFAEKATRYFSSLKLPKRLPKETSILNPYSKKEISNAVQRFFIKYFDNNLL